MKVGAAAATAAMVVAAVSSVCAAYGCAANGCAAYGRAVNEGDEGGGRGFPCSTARGVQTDILLWTDRHLRPGANLEKKGGLIRETRTREADDMT